MNRILVERLRAQAERTPERAFLDMAGRKIAYGDFWEQVLRLANGLVGAGVKPELPVATLLENSADALGVWLALNTAGGFDAALNPELRGALLAHQLNDCGAELLILESHLVPRVAEILGSLPRAKRILYRGPAPRMQLAGIRLEPLDAYRSGEAKDPSPAVDAAPLSSVLYTGGTTGPSKGCMIGQHYFHDFCLQHNRALSLTDRDVIWTPLPLFHINARSTAIGALLVGGFCGFDERFSLRGFWPALARVGATHARVIAGIFRVLADAAGKHPRPEGSTLRCIIGSGATPELSDHFERHWRVPAVAPGYGMTEASMIVDIGTDWSRVPRGSVGRRSDAYEVEIVDRQDNILPPGSEGEIVIRPKKPNRMFAGYWNRPADTLARLRNLWFHTGDIGRFDDNGWFYFVGRKDDFVRRRGENIPAYEVEAVVLQHPDVAEAAIHAVASDAVAGDEEVKLTAVLRAGAVLDEPQLSDWLAARLPAYALPRFIEFRSALPKGAVARVAKHILKREGKTPATWDRLLNGGTAPGGTA